MQEFMFFIRKQSSSQNRLAADEHQKFLKACESYIANLKKEIQNYFGRIRSWKISIMRKTC